MTTHDDNSRPPRDSGQHSQPGETAREDMAASLFRQLSPYLDPMSRDEFQRLVSNGISPASGLAATAPAPSGPLAASNSAQAAPQPGLGPEMTAEDAMVEASLSHSASPQYQGEVWWKRTISLISTWNQMRRRMGHLSPHYQQINAYWQQPDWADFNQARRQADSQGADYEQWTAAQFQRPGRQDQFQAPLPQEMHGPQAQIAWHSHLDACRRQGQCMTSGGPPYNNDTFDLYNPQHVAYAQTMLDEIMVLAVQVFANDPQGPALLLAQALQRGNLPPLALELVPQLKERVLLLAGLPLPPEPV